MIAQADTSAAATEALSGEKIEVIDLVRLVGRQWKWTAATFVIAALLIIAALSTVKPQWEAQATVRIGDVYDASMDVRRPIEPLQEVVERMRVRGEALKSADVSPDPALEGLRLGSAKVDAIPQTSLVRVTARSSSPEQASLYVKAVVDHIRLVHGSVLGQVRSEAERLAAEYTEQLASLRDLHSSLERALSSAMNSSTGDGPSGVVPIAQSLEKNSRELNDLKRQKFLLLMRNEIQSSPTTMVGDISSLRVASTSKGLVVTFGVVMGLALGLLVAVLRDYFVRMRSRELSTQG